MRTRLVSLLAVASVAAFVLAVPAEATAANTASARPSVVVPATWSQLASPGIGTANYEAAYYGASCAGPTFCVAVGNATESNTGIQMAAQWNGTSWSSITNALPPIPNTSIYAQLTGVSCVSTKWCMIVGDDNPGGGSYSSFADLWNGSTWRSVAVPNVAPGDYGEYPQAISCTSPSFCVAPVVSFGSNTFTNSVLQWNGTSWSSVALSAAPPAAIFLSVSCVATWCQMVGSDAGANLSGTTEYAMTLNGGTWQNESIPSAPAKSNLFGVSCVTPSFCQAVGVQKDNGSTGVMKNLVETWNGTAWSIMSVPDSTAGYADGLYAVDCFGPTSCVAGGFDNFNPYFSSGVGQALSWNGSTWTTQDLPQVTASDYSAIWALSCVANSMCFAVGSAETPLGMIAAASVVRPGYTEVAADGGLFNFGAPFYGSMGGQPLNQPIVGMAITPDGGGYWEVASDGGIFAFGDATFYGSMGGKPLNEPIVGIASTPDGGGYFEVASDGGLFAFGDAIFDGSMGGQPLNKPIVGMAITPDGGGYWEVASDGGIFAFGDATFYGSMGGKPLNEPIVGIASTPDGGGYFEVASDGGLFAFGDAIFEGSMGGKPLNKPVVGMTIDPTGGYYEVASDGGIFAFGGAPFLGSMGGKPLNEPIVDIAS